MSPIPSITLTPIGVVRSPFPDKRSAPRQSTVSNGAEGQIVLHDDSRYNYALEDLERWSHLWVLFWFHLNDSWRPKVRPPRSVRKRGVFSTRSPHRPNPIGLSAVELVRIERRVVYVRNLDIVDGSPVLDLKPYVPYADAIGAAHGWLADSPDRLDAGPRYAVQFDPMALEQLEWLRDRYALDLRGEVQQALCIGATPHPYRRIKRDDDGLRLALRDWRFRFRVEDRIVIVSRLVTGYRPRVLNDPNAQPSADTPLEVHRAFVARFG
jgi:tRNA-Thr(GGU) m(6)t(6)A37 methyltransferase TsaA